MPVQNSNCTLVTERFFSRRPAPRRGGVGRPHPALRLGRRDLPEPLHAGVSPVGDRQQVPRRESVDYHVQHDVTLARRLDSVRTEIVLRLLCIFFPLSPRRPRFRHQISKVTCGHEKHFYALKLINEFALKN